MTDLEGDVNKEEIKIRLQDKDNMRQGDTKSGDQDYNDSSNLSACRSECVAVSLLGLGMFMDYFMEGLNR